MFQPMLRMLPQRWMVAVVMMLAFSFGVPPAPAATQNGREQLGGYLLFVFFPPLREALREAFHRNQNWIELISTVEVLSEMVSDARSVQVFESADKEVLQSGRATRLLWDEFVRYRGGLPKGDGQWSVVAICVTSREDNAGIDPSQQPVTIFKHGVKRGDVLKDYKERGVFAKVDLRYLDDHSNEPPTVAILIADRRARQEDRKEPKGHVGRVSADVSFVLAGLENGNYRVHVLKTRIRNVDDEHWEIVATPKSKSH